MTLKLADYQLRGGLERRDTAGNYTALVRLRIGGDLREAA